MPTEPKMVPTAADVEAFLEAVPHEGRRGDARTLVELMHEVTGEPPVLWGASIVGFGSYRWRYESGREGDSPLAAFSPRRADLVVYMVGGYQERFAALLEDLGPHKGGTSCLYLKRLSTIDLDVLRQLVERSMEEARG